MKKKYIVDGKVYEIPDNESESFLKDFPDAKVSYNVEGKEYEIPHKEADAFESDMGLKKKDSGQLPSNSLGTPLPLPVQEIKDNSPFTSLNPSKNDYNFDPNKGTGITMPDKQAEQPLDGNYKVDMPDIPNYAQGKDATTNIAPQKTQDIQDFKLHNEEKKAKHKELVNQAIENTVQKLIKNKGISDKDGLTSKVNIDFERARLKNDVYKGDATFTINPKTGELGLNRTIGPWESIKKGWDASVNAAGEAKDFLDASPEEQVAIVNKKQAENQNPEYLGERSTDLGSALGWGTAQVPFLAKAATGALVGTALAAAAPATGGISAAGVPTALAFAFTAPDMINQGAADEIKRRFEILKSEKPEESDVALMTEARQGQWSGGLSGLATNTLLTGEGNAVMKAPIAEEAKNVVSKAIKKTVGAMVSMGGKTAAVDALKLTEGNLEGIKATPSEIAESAAKTFVEQGTVGGLLHITMGAIHGLPKVLLSAAKFGLSKVNPAVIEGTLKMNEEAGTVPKGTTEKVMNDIEGYKVALSKTMDGLSSEVKASVAGLIQAKDNLIEQQKSKDSSHKPYFDEKIKGIDEQIQKTINTGKPYAHEIDEISGTTYKAPSEETEINKESGNDQSIKTTEPVQPVTGNTEGQGTEKTVSENIDGTGQGDAKNADAVLGSEAGQQASTGTGDGNETFYTGRGKKFEDLKQTKGDFIFFSKDPKVSEWYGGHDGNVSEANFDTKNFIDLTTQEKKAQFVKDHFTDKDIAELYPDLSKRAIDDRDVRKTWEQKHKKLIDEYRQRLQENRFSGDGKEQQFLLKKLKEKGYAGVKLSDTFFGKEDISYVVLDKSIITQKPQPKGEANKALGSEGNSTSLKEAEIKSIEESRSKAIEEANIPKVKLSLIKGNEFNEIARLPDAETIMIKHEDIKSKYKSLLQLIQCK